MTPEVFVTYIERSDSGRSVGFNAFVGNRIVQLRTFLDRSGSMTIPDFALVRCAAKKQSFDVREVERSVRCAVVDTLGSLDKLFKIGES